MNRQSIQNTASATYLKVQGLVVSRIFSFLFAFIVGNAALSVACEIIPEPFDAARALISRFVQSATPAILVLGCLIPLFIVDAIVQVSRILTPIFRFQAVMTAVARGEHNIRMFKLRKGNYWGDLVHTFGVMTRKLKQEGAAQQIAEMAANGHSTSSSDPFSNPW